MIENVVNEIIREDPEMVSFMKGLIFYKKAIDLGYQDWIERQFEIDADLDSLVLTAHMQVDLQGVLKEHLIECEAYEEVRDLEIINEIRNAIKEDIRQAKSRSDSQICTGLGADSTVGSDQETWNNCESDSKEDKEIALGNLRNKEN